MYVTLLWYIPCNRVTILLQEVYGEVEYLWMANVRRHAIKPLSAYWSQIWGMPIPAGNVDVFYPYSKVALHA